jgi:hypothetical protein
VGFEASQIQDKFEGTKLALIDKDNKVVTILAIGMTKKKIHKMIQKL